MNKLLILDFDGTLAGNKIYNLDLQGNLLSISKQVSDKSWSAIKLLKYKHNWKVCVLSGCNTNEPTCKFRKIDFHYVNADWESIVPRKHEYLPMLWSRYDSNKENTFTIADDYFDISLMRALLPEHCFCPSDAAKIIRDYAITLPSPGGGPVVEEFCTYLGLDSGYQDNE